MTQCVQASCLGNNLRPLVHTCVMLALGFLSTYPSVGTNLYLSIIWNMSKKLDKVKLNAVLTLLLICTRRRAP